ncbi:MAG: rhodanese-like domain-containing protein [Chloroflexota bacterium]
MLLTYFYDKALAQASYLVGSPTTGEALIIDPARDISPYLQAAREENLTITQVAETHIHADFVSGSRELAARTGARLYLSAIGGAASAYSFADALTGPLRDGDCWHLGGVQIDVIHAPGHTPEHLIFQLTDTPATNQPFALFTGDCLFVGDVGRPDLQDAAGNAGTIEQGAREQFRNIQRLKAMPDYLQILPGHGAGSVCGKALGAVPTSTLGYEKRVNPAFQFEDETAFVEWLLSNQPETPPYLAQMQRVNREGAPLLETLIAPPPMEGFILAEMLKNGALVLDARTDGGHVPGALHLPPEAKFSTYAGWFVDYAAPTYLIAAPDQVASLVNSLRAIGVDDLPGYFTPEEVGDLNAELPTLRAEDAAQSIGQGALALDVRSRTEYQAGHIAGALHIPYGLLTQQVDALPADRMIVVHCATGARSQIAASLLMKHGFRDFASIQGGLDAWKQAGLPLTTG